MTTHRNNSETHSEQLEQRLDELNQFKIDLGLDRLHQVLAALGLKQPKAKIITVGGTNGKGSTVAAISQLLAAKGMTYGAFTSPHIFKFNERININGQPATDEAIIHAFDVIEQAKADIHLSYFEYAFLAAVVLFDQHQVDVMVLEVGLGGRLDATNALDADAAIITTVDFDHMEWLGDDLETIGFEKAGIMRPDKPIIYADEAMPQSIRTQAKQVGAELLAINQDYEVIKSADHWSYRLGDQPATELNRPAMRGDWQINNFASALTALNKLGYSYDVATLNQVLSNWQVPGRLQVHQTDPLVLADVAHNQQATEALREWLKQHPIPGQTIAVFSVLADKTPGSWLSALDEVFDHWLIFQLDNERSMDLAQLTATMADHVTLISQFNSGKEAHAMALDLAHPEDRIVVFGSFHVLEAVFQ